MTVSRVLLVLATVTWRCLCQDCPLPYGRFSQDHTSCRSPNGNCNIQRRGVSDNDIDVIVDTHNDLRNRVATGNEDRKSMPASANQVQMVWDEELASIAQAHADQCTFEHDCNDCRDVDNFSVGQNLYQMMTSSTSVPVPNWSRAITSWNDEVTQFDPDWISPFQSNSAVGHFTQVQWATTWKVGCGFAVFDSAGSRYRYTALYTCNYGPAGNIQRGQMYAEGETCSQCPRNTCCGDQCSAAGVTADYDGLCKSIDDRGPQPPPPPTSNLLSCTFGSSSGDCSRTVTGTNRWQVRSVLSGNYTSTVLRNGETTQMRFPVGREATNQSSQCIRFSYRKGPSLAGQSSDNSFRLLLTIPSMSWTTTTDINGDSNDWMQYRMSARWRNPTQVSFNFTARDNAPDQHLDIRNLLIVPGSC